MLIDTHAHLDDGRFDRDREEIIKSLKENDIDIVINPGANVATSVKAVSLAEKYENIYAAVGVHPHDAKDINDDTLELLKSLANKEKVVAIGEAGLDYHYDNSPRDIQRKWFREQIRLAKELDLPIIVHSRDAHKDTFDIIKEENTDNLRGVLHCYSGSAELAREYIKMGFYISLAGPVTFKNAKTPKQVAKEISLDYLLIETDSPYLTPHPHRGKRNEPLYVRYVAGMIAELKEISFEKVAKKTSENAKKLFNIG
ncbi:TatD family hydrolase [Thermohalobacter berrensis]|uniref:Hydrolase TatD n=1 Tax=Thermohalobacter berrensis TaxID=99594 RepID=A0A419SUD2_9FIRM|nr:TatD family hydrolase [Thermohalobacter berrensis]RKD28849.1 hydrolase TatD [Thermohalobacter berrensis]